MSLYAMTTVWYNTPNIAGNELVVLLALADWSDDRGLSWHSIGDIAKKAHVSDRTVQRCLDTLTAIGYLRIDRGGQDGYSRSRYWLQLDAIVGGDKLTPVTVLSPGGDSIDTRGVTAIDTRYVSNTKDIPKATLLSPQAQSQAIVPLTTAPASATVGTAAPASQVAQPFDLIDIKPRTALGSLVPEAVQVNPAGYEWAQANGWRGTQADLQLEMGNFVDWWKGQGDKGRKLDWIATVRMWIRRQISWGKDLPTPKVDATALTVRGQNDGHPGQRQENKRSGYGYDKAGNPTNKATSLYNTAGELARRQQERARRSADQVGDDTVTLSDDEWRVRE